MGSLWSSSIACAEYTLCSYAWRSTATLHFRVTWQARGWTSGIHELRKEHVTTGCNIPQRIPWKTASVSGTPKTEKGLNVACSKILSYSSLQIQIGTQRHLQITQRLCNTPPARGSSVASSRHPLPSLDASPLHPSIRWACTSQKKRNKCLISHVGKKCFCLLQHEKKLTEYLKGLMHVVKHISSVGSELKIRQLSTVWTNTPPTPCPPLSSTGSFLIPIIWKRKCTPKHPYGQKRPAFIHTHNYTVNPDHVWLQIAPTERQQNKCEDPHA